MRPQPLRSSMGSGGASRGSRSLRLGLVGRTNGSHCASSMGTDRERRACGGSLRWRFAGAPAVREGGIGRVPTHATRMAPVASPASRSAGVVPRGHGMCIAGWELHAREGGDMRSSAQRGAHGGRPSLPQPRGSSPSRVPSESRGAKIGNPRHRVPNGRAQRALRCRGRRGGGR